MCSCIQYYDNQMSLEENWLNHETALLNPKHRLCTLTHRSWCAYHRCDLYFSFRNQTVNRFKVLIKHFESFDFILQNVFDSLVLSLRFTSTRNRLNGSECGYLDVAIAPTQWKIPCPAFCLDWKRKFPSF